ncbi:GDYXXLXY domain-containing protein [uncultured Kordia sp.]|uniref:GDYXXLXY domain-containing protein n=1 Tax=uncultured Kordia sp. TaxID=507699 RepID=UPI0026238204|nr:GDYXXLXY domain-containing protein [uncultured Kordia sp.]
MKKSYIYALFGLMVLAQIVASAQIVYKYERTIASNNVYKFKTAPVDPNDPFRGKYITLDYQINSFKTSDESWDDYDVGYAYFSKDENGFAVLETLVKEPYSASKFDYIQVEINNHYDGYIHFDLPLDRYYMEESKAYDAEVLSRELNRNGTTDDIYAVIHIESNIHVLTDVVVNGVSMKDAVAK